MNVAILEDNINRKIIFTDQCKQYHHNLIVMTHKIQPVLDACKQGIDVLFLDHDLGTNQTGMDFVKQLVKIRNTVQIGTIVAHSDNRSGAANMVSLLSQAGFKAFSYPFSNLPFLPSENTDLVTWAKTLN